MAIASPPLCVMGLAIQAACIRRSFGNQLQVIGNRVIRRASGATKLKAGVSDVNGLARLAPDLGITNDTQYTKTTVCGTSSQDHDETANLAITINIEGEYINRLIALNASFFDLERVEVLRGPQGTFYGRNATAGALNIVAAKPRLGEFSGSATGGYGNFDAIPGEAAINIPLGDEVAIRASGMPNEHDGYFNNAPAARGSAGNTDAASLSICGQRRPDEPAYASGIVDAIPSTPLLENGGVPRNLRFDPLKKSFPLDDFGFTRIKQYAVCGRLDIGT